MSQFFGVRALTLSPPGGGVVNYITIPNYATFSAVGDSYTAGVGASPSTNGWVYLVAASLGSTLTNSGVAGTVLENSVASGGSALSGNLRDNYVSYALGSNKKAAVFIAYGFNDARYTGAPATFNVTQYQADYREILNGLVIGGYASADIYVISPWYITASGLSTGSAGFTGQSRLGFEAFITAALAVATEYGTAWTDCYNSLNTAAWIADVDGNDHLHPQNYGHSRIASTVLSGTLRPNSRAAPVTVSVAAAGATLTVTASAVTGAASYEYALILNPVDYASNTDGVFASVAAGDYYARARAVFGDGSKGPWTFSTTTATAAVSGTFVNDSFTDSSGVTLSSHSPETGGAWSVISGTSMKFTAANRIYTPGSTSIMRNAAAPATADYYVETVIDFISAVASETVGIAARMNSGGTDFYWARWSGGNWQLWKTVSGSSTQLGSNSADAFTSGSRTLRLTVTGTTLVVRVDGVDIITQNDGAITAAGFAGIRNTTMQSATTGRQMTSFKAFC